MATKEFITLEGLTRYDQLIKTYIGEADADAIKSISVSGNTVSFYRSSDASGTAYATVEIPDVSGFMDKISGATGGKIVTSTSAGQVAESATAISDLATNAFVGSLPQGAESTTVVDYIGEAIEDATGDCLRTAPGVSIQSGYFLIGESDGTVGLEPMSYYMLKGDDWEGDKVAVTSNDGSVSESELSVSDIATTSDLDDKMDKIASATGGNLVISTSTGQVAESGTAISDLATKTFVGSIPAGATATTVVGYIDEAVAEAEDDSEITLVEAQTPTTGYLKTYELYQGGNAAANLVGKIDIPKDLVVTSGEIVVNPTGQPAGTYLKLTIANQTTPVYINVADLCDVYTAASGATQVQLAISATNEISATLVAGGVGTTELAGSAVTTAKIADSNVTKAKLAQGVQDSLDLADSAVQSVAEGATNGTVAVDGTDIAVHGLGSAAYTASTAYATAAQGALADTSLQPSDIGEVSNSDIEALFS